MRTKGDALGMSKEDIQTRLKSVRWEVCLTDELKKQTSPTHVWIADRLSMGVPQAVTIYTGRLTVKNFSQNSVFSTLFMIVLNAFLTP